MEVRKAIDILQILADGVDPNTGELFPDDSPYANPDVIRALFTCIQHIKSPPKKVKRTTEERQADNLRNNLPKNAGMPWSDELKEELKNSFCSGTNVVELADKFSRTKGAIVSELRKQNLVTEEEAKSL